MIDIKSIEILDSQNTTGTTALKGNAGMKLTASIEFYVHWEVENTSLDFLDDTITANNVSTDFIAENFKPDDIIQVVGTTSNNGTYQVVAVPTSDKLVCQAYGSGSGSGSASTLFTTETASSGSVYGITPVKALKFFYNLIENSSSVNFASIIDGETQVFATGYNDFDSTPTKALAVNSVNKSWVTGTTSDLALNEVQYLGLGGSSVSTGYEQAFTATLVFYIAPVLLEGYLDGNDEFNINQNPEFYQNACLRFVQSWEASFDGTAYYHNTGQGNEATWNNIFADTGWINERGNGGVSDYTLSSITLADQYGNAVTEIGYNSDTEITAVINDANSVFDFNTNFEVSLWEMPNQADYQNNTSTMFTNFDVSRVYLSQLDGTQSNNNLEVTVNASGATATLTITVSADTNNIGRRYALFVATQDSSFTNYNLSNVASVLLTQGERVYNVAVDGIFDCPQGVKINEHPTNDPDKGFTNYEGWVEDDILSTMEYSLAKTTDDGRIVRQSTVNYQIMAIHATDSTKDFVIESKDFTLGTDLGRGYTGLPLGDENKNKFYLQQIQNTSTRIYYKIEAGQILGYEYWQSLNVNSADFPNATKSLSEYQDNPNYSLEIWFNIGADLVDSVSGLTEDVTFRRRVLLSANAYDEFYDSRIDKNIYGVVSTSLQDGTSLGTSISTTENTYVTGTFYGKELFPCIWVEGSGSGSGSYSYSSSLSNSYSYSDSYILPDCYDFWGSLTLDSIITGGRSNVDICSTEYSNNLTSAWVGQPTIVQYPYMNPPRVEVRGIIDVNEIGAKQQYDITARLGEKRKTLCTTSIITTTDATTYQNNELIDYTEEGLLVFFNRREKFNDGSFSLNSATGTITVGDVQGYTKICCSIDPITTTLSNDSTYSNPSLVGLSSNDFIAFNNGLEKTTASGFSFTSGTGEMDFGTLLNGELKISFHVALVTDTLSSQTTYTNAALIGRTLNDILIFVNGNENTTTSGGTFTSIDSSTGTLTFSSAQSGTIKVVEVSG